MPFRDLYCYYLGTFFSFLLILGNFFILNRQVINKLFVISEEYHCNFVSSVYKYELKFKK